MLIYGLIQMKTLLTTAVCMTIGNRIILLHIHIVYGTNITYAYSHTQYLINSVSNMTQHEGM